MNVETKQVKLSALKLNPNNPRRIGNKEMERLVKSLQEFPDMLSIREIVVDETMTVLGGNMRLLALKKSGAKECTAKIVTGLTPEQKREFIIKDNSNFGYWDFDILSGWDDLPLADWGVPIPNFTDPNEEWKGMPECNQEDKTAFKSLTVNFATQGGVDAFAELIGQAITKKTRSIWHPKAEIERYADKRYKDES